MVIYTTANPIKAIWASNTQGMGGVKLCMQTDGNLVLYTASNSPIWNTATFFAGATVELQYDGQLAVWKNGVGRYATGNVASCVTTVAPVTTPKPSRVCNIGMAAGECIVPGDVIYSCFDCFKLLLRDDGVLAVYTTVFPVKLVWSSPTQGKSGIKACMQTDGNFVLYTATGSAVWATGTSYNFGAFLEMQSDGELVIWHNGVSKYASGATASCVSP